MNYYDVEDEHGNMHKVYHYAISLITLTGIRDSGKMISIITNLKSKRIKYIDKFGVIRSTDNKRSFKILKYKEVPKCLRKITI